MDNTNNNTINFDNYKLYIISNDGPSREACSVFYAQYIIAKSKKEAVESALDDAEYDPATDSFNYIGNDPNMNSYYDEYFVIEENPVLVH